MISGSCINLYKLTKRLEQWSVKLFHSYSDTKFQSTTATVVGYSIHCIATQSEPFHFEAGRNLDVLHRTFYTHKTHILHKTLHTRHYREVEIPRFWFEWKWKFNLKSKLWTPNGSRHRSPPARANSKTLFHSFEFLWKQKGDPFIGILSDHFSVL